MFRRLVTAPGELGLGRAYVSGELDVEGDLYAALAALRDRTPDLRTFGAGQWADVLRLAGSSLARSGPRPLPVPPGEARLSVVRHSTEQDAAAIAHHYDVSSAFYRIVLGASMTYSCAVWERPDVTLEQGQAAKYELVCRKLGLEPGMRLLDVGCGWGGMVLHAATHHGVRAVGVTLSRRQAEWAEKASPRPAWPNAPDPVPGLPRRGRRAVRRDQLDRDVRARGAVAAPDLLGLAPGLLRPGGRLLNHGISRPPNAGRTRFRPRIVIDRRGRRSGELHEVGAVVSTIQPADLEVRHLESLREHTHSRCGPGSGTSRRAGTRPWPRWVRVGRGCGGCTWAASALNFEAGRTQVHQVLAVRLDRGRSGLPLRPRFV